MNKLKIAIAISMLTPLAKADQQNLIIGANLNYIKSDSKKFNMTATNHDDESGVRNTNLNSTHFTPGFILGYNNIFDKNMVEGAYEFTNDQLKKRKNSGNSRYYNNAMGTDLSLTSNSTFQIHHKNTHALSFKYGYEFFDKTFLYVKAALLHSQFKIKFEKYGITQSKHQYGFAPGIGIDYIINNNFSMRGEYNYRMYRKIKTPQTKLLNSRARFTYITTIKPREHHIGLSLVYKFNLSK